MKITYIDHSGFCVECENVVFIFDYYKGELPEFERKKKIYVFVSHVHFDHFTKKIFTWNLIFPDITYILSDDIPKGDNKGKILRIEPDEEIDVDGIHIQTLRSTDEGVAFFVSAEGKKIYHAGDLNWWHWEEEGTAYNLEMERAYKQEIKKIKGQKIDVAFVPADPRLGSAFYYGIDWFMRQTDTECVFPMHMQEEYEINDRLMKEAVTKNYRNKIMHIEHCSQQFELG